jgi:microcystin-dependent protein
VTYAGLFGVVGTTYGVGDSSTTFNLPNLLGRIPVGQDTTQAEFNVLGEAGGSKTLSIGVTNLPAHDHAIDHNHAEVSSSTDSHSHSGTTASAGSHTHSYQDSGASNASVSSGSTSTVADNGFVSRSTGSAGSHTHSFSTSTDSHSHTVNLPNFVGTSGSTGSGTALPSLPPYIALNYIIKS